MSKIFSRAVLAKWLEKVADTNTTYHVNRQRLFEQLVAISKLQADENKDNYLMPLATFNRLKQFLTARNDALAKNDAVGLSFTKTVEEISKELEETIRNPEQGLQGGNFGADEPAADARETKRDDSSS